jgi:hypothetical protein
VLTYDEAVALDEVARKVQARCQQVMVLNDSPTNTTTDVAREDSGQVMTDLADRGRVPC